MDEAIGATGLRCVLQQIFPERDPKIKPAAPTERPVCRIEERADVEDMLQDIGRQEDIKVIGEGQPLRVRHDRHDLRLPDHAGQIRQRDVHRCDARGAAFEELAHEIALARSDVADLIAGLQLYRLAQITGEVLDIALVQHLGVEIVLGDAVIIVGVAARHIVDQIGIVEQHRQSVAVAPLPAATAAREFRFKRDRAGRANQHGSKWGSEHSPQGSAASFELRGSTPWTVANGSPGAPSDGSSRWMASIRHEAGW